MVSADDDLAPAAAGQFSETLNLSQNILAASRGTIHPKPT